MAFTYLDAQNYLKIYNRMATSQQDADMIAKAINDGNRNFHAYGEWSFDKRHISFPKVGPYSTGTVTVVNNSATITGVGTTWTAAMTGRLMRVAGQATQYVFTFVSTTSGTLDSVFYGVSASAQTYAITDERYALPAYFRTVCNVQIDDVVTPLLPCENEDMVYMRKLYREISFPRQYAVEFLPSTALVNPASYLWLYPAPTAQYLIDLFFYIFPSECTQNADVFQVPYAAEGVLRQFMLAELYRYQQNPQTSAQLGNARREADISLAAFRARKEMSVKQEWQPWAGAGRSQSDIDWIKPGTVPF